MPKRPPPAERVPLTDEWGIYDPAKAGMQALYARLGRPVLRASSKSMRQERRRGFRPERPNDGVGLAIEEAMRRAGILIPPTPVEETIAQGSAARAVRLALKAAKAAKAPKVTDDVQEQATKVADVQEQALTVADRAQETADVSATAPKRKTLRRAKTGAALVPEQVAATPPVEIQPVEIQVAAPAAEPESASKTRTGRKTAKTRAKVEAAPAVAPGAPPPSPRRPRGPVPLAAWARAVVDAPTPEPRRADRRGFWGALFRIPAEVALVEYAHGCRIHRLLIETSDVPSHDFL